MKIFSKKIDDVITYKINDYCNIFDVEMFKRLTNYTREISSKMMIYEGLDLFDCSFPPQVINFVNVNGVKISVANSKNAMKVSTVEEMEDKILEYIVEVDFQKENYSIIKYIHTLNHSTISADYYSDDYCTYTGDKREAINICYYVIDKMDEIDEIIHYDNKELFINILLNKLSLIEKL